ncbi:hypothetical protein KXW84_003764 [Aspergillus fumigatus]|nr:hypothetical protein KXW84_003764 [Aspergillus fumigatus]
MADHITPPGTVTESPLTPPPSDRKASFSVSSVVDVLRSHKKGCGVKPWAVYLLSPDDYERLGASFDYDPLRSRLAIRMPTPVHEIFCANVVHNIMKQLERFEQCNRPEARYAKEIQHFASSRLELPDQTDDGTTKYIRREPDASFGHRLARFPGVIIEVCYAQKARQINSLADDYILCSDGSVNVVICLDIEYRASRKATLSIWRPQVILRDDFKELRACRVVNEHVWPFISRLTTAYKLQAFRTDDGQPVEPTSLRLMLKDFATEELTRNCPNLEQEIVLSSEDLCGFLADAEARQTAQERQSGSVNRLSPGVRKRRRSETPDGVSSDVEAHPEDNVRKRSRYESDYVPSSPSADSNG